MKTDNELFEELFEDTFVAIKGHLKKPEISKELLRVILYLDYKAVATHTLRSAAEKQEELSHMLRK